MQHCLFLLEHNQASKKFNKLLELVGKGNFASLEKRREEYEKNGKNLYNDFMNLKQEVDDFENELFALYEVQIIYAFKNLEIRIKGLISQSYPTEILNKNSKWGNLIEFLRFKKIEPKNILGYKEINELRIVNNSIKHSASKIDNSLNEIEEFKEQNNLSFELLKSFYQRVKSFPNLFVKALSEMIVKDIYEFNEERLFTMAKSLAERMTIEQATKFNKLLSKHYKK